jgi:dimethylargininase
VRGNPARTFVASWRENARAPVAGVIRIQIVIGSAMRVFDFHHAIVRAPCRSVIDGIRSDAHAEPSFEKISKEHETYVAALRDAGLAVDVLPPLERYPDSMFVEDPAFVIPEGAIQLRSGADARRGEGEEIASALRRHFHTVLALEGDEYVDGGDVLIAPDGIFIGLSKRTNRKGAEALREMLAKLGRKSRIAQTPDTILHFKTAVSLLTEDMLVTTKVMAASGIFAGFKIFIVPDDEEPAANLLRVNDVVFVGKNFPRTIDLVAKQGLRVVPLPVSEIGKLDAGLSCMSLRWSKGR